jgi:hypothetical protein
MRRAFSPFVGWCWLDLYLLYDESTADVFLASCFAELRPLTAATAVLVPCGLPALRRSLEC